LVMAAGIFACSTAKPVARVSEVVINEDTTIGKYGVDSAKTVMQYSLYIEYYKQDNYNDAYRFWRYLFSNAPRFNKGIYVNGAKMVKKFAKTATDPAIKQQWIDTLMNIYDQRIIFYNEEGYVLGKKGTDLFTLNPKTFEEAYGYLSKSMELSGNSTNKTVPYYCIYCSTIMLKNKKITTDDLIEKFNQANEIIDYNLSNGNSKGWESISQNVLDLAKPYLSCDKLIPAFTKSLTKNPDNLKMLLKFQATMEIQGCTDNDFYMHVSEKVFEMEPNAKRANSLGIAYYSKGNFSRAVSFYLKAVELEEDAVTKAKYYMSLADAYRKNGNKTAARAAAQNAASNNPSVGTPNIFIGDLYATSAESCSNKSFEKKTIYWIAVDQYKIALSKGDENASMRINKYTQYFPTKEEAFYQDPPVKDGESYNIGCWINASTTARFNE